MKEMKRILSLVLCFVMLVGMLPAITLNADAATGAVIDAAIFCSDVHGNQGIVKSVFSAIKNADSTFDPTTAAFAGDTDMSTSTVTSEATGVYSDIACYYSYGSHETDTANVTDLVYGDSTTNYYIYFISQSSMSSNSPDTSGFTSDVASMDKTKPLFIVSHMPLHERRNDNYGAAAWYTAISAAAKEMDIVFFWAHNHTGETEVDQAAYYVAKNGSETMTIEGGSTVTPNFTYMNAGFIGQSAGRGGVVTTVKIYSDAMVFQDYNSSGAYTGSHAHNVEVARTATSGDSGSTDETTAPTTDGDDTTTESKEVYVLVDELTVGKDYLIANGNTGTVTLLGQSSGSAATTTATVVTEGDYTYIETADTGYVWNATAHPNSSYSSYPRLINAESYAMYLSSSSVSFSSSLSSTSGAVYTRYWTYTDGVMACPSTNSSSSTYYLTYSSSAFASSSSSATGIYIYEKQTIETEVEITLSSISAACSKTYNVGDTFSAEDLVVTATYSDGSTAVVTPTSVSTPDMTTAGTKTVTVTYTEGDVTKETTVDITVNEVISETATVTGIAVSGGKTEFNLNETFSTEGLVVTATYDDNGTTKTKVLSSDEYTVSTVDMTTEGEKTVTVSYTYNGTTVTDTYTVTVTEKPSNEVTLGGSTTEEKTVYVLTSSITSGKSYLVVNGNSAGSYYALANNSGSVAATGVTVKTDDTIGTYIELEDATDELWTVSGSSSTSLKNGSYYLGYSGSKGNYSLALESSSTTWTYSSNRLSVVPNKTTYYVVYDSGWDMNSSSDNIYFYVPTEVEITTDGSVKYTMRAEDLKQVVDTTNADTLTADLSYCLQGNGADLTTLPSGGSYSFTVLSDANGIINGEITDGVVNFTGKTGTATVKVAYTWTADDGNTYTIYKNITVEATEPYYELDLHKANTVVNEVTGLNAFDSDKTYYTKNEDGTYTQVAADATPDSTVTYYYVTFELGDEITAPIAIKGIEAGDRYGVWAVVTGYDGVLDSEGNDGETLGSVGSAIEWSSSDESIATVDPVTGIITFTGKEGTVNITADYAYGTEGKVATDTITISVTPDKYTLPADGTTDFPEYPNEGAIRYDKTAEAVGNFSETGIAQLELSMTGVPYTTGSEIDVVLMLDMTGSMTTESMAAAEAAALAFARQIILNTDGTYNDNRISIQIFNVNGVTELWAMSAVTADTYSSLVTAIESASDKRVGGGTPYSTALSGCKDILDAAKKDGVGNDRTQYCVFVSDGTPTSMTMISNYAAVKAGTATSYTTTTSSSYYGTYPEYYSTLMKDNGVTVYGVYTSAAAGSSGGGSGSGGGSVNDSEEGTAIMKTVASSDDKVYTIEDYTDTSALTGVFTDIAKDILQAATDVIVEDQIADEYTMIFDIPTDTNYDHTISTTQEFYIEFVKYTLDATTHERTGESTSVTKLYLIDSNGADAGGTYSAGSSATTAYAAPTFENVTLGDKGTLYFWTTDSGYASKAAASYTVDGTTYYFIPYGIKATDTGYDSTKWFNMTAGAYAFGNINSVTNTSTDLVIATPYFVYNAATRMLYWTVEKLEDETTEYALRYFLYLDDSATDIGEGTETDPGPYPTNKHAYITYTNFQGNDCRQVFPVPQMTWNGAQVSYVFYLVNANGEPINKSGQVVDFANATFITDIFTEYVVWNDSETPETAEGFAYLDATYKAAELLPGEYTLYDTSAYYELYVYEDAEGNTLDNYFKITGSEANGSTSSTTKVYITKAGTRYSAYGTYTDENVYTGFDFGNTTVAFAVVWEPKLVPDTVVVDFGLDVLINVVQNDLMQNTVSGIGLGKEAYGSTAMNTGVSTTSKLGTANLTVDGNTISIENENQIRFSQNDMTFEAPVTFYYESPVEYYEGSNKQEGYMYSSVTVIPATTIYYEDDFLSYTGDWSTDGTAANATQAQDRPGASLIAAAIDADNNYGFDKAYATMAGASMASSHKITVSSGKDGMASFDFYGTGFDIISMTDTTTGTIFVQVFAYDENGKLDTNNVVASHVVDTYYGYAYALCKVTYTYTANEDGTAGWVATDEIVTTAGESTEKPENPQIGDSYVEYREKWINVDSNDPNALYQVPIMKITDLDYGKYQAQIIAAYDSFFDNVGDGSYDFYLDAIRIYDPTGNKNDDANAAYVKDGEGWPTYEEVRNYVLGQSDTDTLGDDAVTGIVFIDSNAAATTVSDYNNYGPNNELYLAPGQAIAFELSAEAAAGKVAKIQMALKTVYGNASVKIYGIEGTTALDAILDTTLTTATDMYYDITELNNKVVVIMNTGTSGVLSITNVKTTYTEAQPDPAAPVMLFAVRRSSVDAALATMSVEEEETVPETTVPETTVPEETEPETTVPEETEPETTVPEETEPETTVPEETEPETTVPEETEPEETEPSAEEQIKETIEKVTKIIKKLFGWLFG